MRKLLFALATIIISATIMFITINVMPGDPVEIETMRIVREESIPYDMARERAISVLNFNPDEPVMERLINYFKNLMTGNLGKSLIYKLPVTEIIGRTLPWTIMILSVSLALSFTVGVLLGLYIAWKRSKILNTLLTVWQAVFGAIPDYIIAFLLVVLFAVNLHWFPSKGAYTSSVTPGFNAAFIKDVALHAVLPVLSYFITTLVGWTMSMKANTLSVLGEDYITYAQARGLSRGRILVHYVGRNAILPLITTLSISIGMMVGGSPLVENMFVYPGIGFYLSSALSQRDYPLMQGMFLMIIVVVVVAGLFAEFLFKVLNPRLKEAK